MLQEFEVVMEQLRKEEEKVKVEQDKLAKVFTEQIGGEEGRTLKIVHNRHKIQNVSLAENRLLIARRSKFQKSYNKSQNAQEKYLLKLKKDREHREERGRKQQEKIASVSGMKDQLLKARNQIMEERFAARDARIEYTQKQKQMKAKMKQDMASNGKDDRSQRTAHATKVRNQRMKRLTARLKEKEEHVRNVQIKKKQVLSLLSLLLLLYYYHY